MTTMYALAVPTRLSLDTLARRAGMHPVHVRHLAVLGLLDATWDPHGDPWFTPAAVHRIARVQRLHTDLAVNYAAIGLVLDLLDRVDELKSDLRRRDRRGHEQADPEVPGGAA